MTTDRVSIGTKLLGGFAFISLITLLVGAVGLYGLTTALGEATHISRSIKQRGQFLAGSIDLARSSQVAFKIQVQEWKNILLRGHDPEAFDKYLAGFTREQQVVKENLLKLRDLLAAEGSPTNAIDACLQAHAELDRHYRDALKSYDKSDPDAAAKVDRMVKGIDRAPTTALDAIVAEVQQLNEDVTSELEAAFARRNRHIKTAVVAGVAVGVIIAIAMGVFLARTISRRLNTVAETLDMSSREVAAASGQVATASQTLADGSSEQAASLQETSASLEELSSMTKRNADNAGSAKTLANQTRGAAETGAGDMEAMSRAMDDIKAASDNIAHIIKTIDEIAFQTNILALNAAVEAARAGEAGMGFAVVAEEVRNLAQRSANAARETAAKIQDSITKSDHGVQISSKVSGSFREIVAKARKVDEIIGEIATASQEQSDGIEQINRAVSQLDTATQTNAASAEESASASEELSQQAHMLKHAVEELLTLAHGAGAARQEKPAIVSPHSSSISKARKSPSHPVKQLVRPQAGQTVASIPADTTDFFEH